MKKILVSILSAIIIMLGACIILDKCGVEVFTHECETTTTHLGEEWSVLRPDGTWEIIYSDGIYAED